MLTKRQKEILSFVEGFVAREGYSPSLAEIGEYFGLSSPATVHQHLKALEQKGYIARGWNKKRQVTLLGDAPNAAAEPAIELPLLGSIAAGQPIEAVLDQETVSVPQTMIRATKRHYALRVTGDSMIGDHILDGDIVVIEAAQSANNGDTIVALVEGQSATLKRYYREGAAIRLQPANPSMDPIYVEEANLAVQGKVVALLRGFA